MARVTGPLFSFSASGTIAKSVVFSRWRGRDYVRRHAIPHNPRTPLQVAYRALVRWMSQQYSDLGNTAIVHWEAAGEADNVTGLNAAIRDQAAQVAMGLNPRSDPTLSAGTPPTAVRGITGASIKGGVALTWLPPVSNEPDWAYMLYIGVDSDVPLFPKLNLIVPASVDAVTITGLTPGATLFATIQGLNLDGACSTAVTSTSFVPQ